MWEPEVVDKNQWLQIGFKEVTTFYGLMIRGSVTRNAYVTSFYVQYSLDGIIYNYVRNEDREIVVRMPLVSQ